MLKKTASLIPATVFLFLGTVVGFVTCGLLMVTDCPKVMNWIVMSMVMMGFMFALVEDDAPWLLCPVVFSFGFTLGATYPPFITDQHRYKYYLACVLITLALTLYRARESQAARGMLSPER